MSNYTEQLEREYQNQIVEIFRNELGYRYLGKFQYEHGAKSTPNGYVNKPIREEDVRSFLSREGSDNTPMMVDEAIRQLKNSAHLGNNRHGELLTTNCKLYDILTTNVKAKPDKGQNERDVCFFDFQHPENNDFAIAEEVSYICGLTNKNSRPDLVIYVNGIALAVIELKRSIVSLDEGIKQNLSNEKDLIPSFFTTVQFTIAASDKNGFEYGTIGTPRKFWCPWKKDGSTVNNETDEVKNVDNPPLEDKAAFRSFFNKDTFMHLVRYGVIDDGGTKKVMRPHQYYALRAAMPRLKAKADGVIWHSQGSGKSLTMVWLAKYIHSNFEDPRVLVITDRTELDSQIQNAFLRSNEDAIKASSSDDLLDLLAGGEQWLICSLIHKFGKHIDPETGKEVVGYDNAPIPLEKYLDELKKIVAKKYPNGFKAKWTNKFVFVDECHRTQGGRLHEAMRLIMGDDVMFIGFTGTPLLKEQKKRGGFAEYKKAKNTSEIRFGAFIHTYLHKEAVADKVILDLQYEGRNVEQEIRSKDKLDEKLNQLLAETSEENQQLIKDRWATLEKVYSSSERIERIGYSILDDLSRYPFNQDWCNAMLVAGNIYSAYKYYKFFQYKCENHGLRGRCAVVTSYQPNESDLRKVDDGNAETIAESKYKYEMAKKSFEEAGVTDADRYEEWAKKKFKEQPSQMKLLIVVDKLLTGFDAPSATHLYIDRDMCDHNLFQAICRVNRLGEDLKKDKSDPNSETIFSHKEYGLIVDFKILFDNIQNAIDKFNKGAFDGYDPSDIGGILEDALTKGKSRLERSLKAYRALVADWQRQGLTDNDKLAEYYKEPEQKMFRITVYKILDQFVTSYHNIADNIIKAGYTQDEASEIHRMAGDAACTRKRIAQASGDDVDLKAFDPQMRNLLDQYIRAEDAETVIPATADFSFLDLLTKNSDTEETAQKAEKEAKSKKGAAEKIEAKVRQVINDWNARDKSEGMRFSEQLKAIIESAQKQIIDDAKRIRELIELLKEMNGKGGDKHPESIVTAFARALFNNASSWCNVTEESELVALIADLEEFFRENVGADWKDMSRIDGKKCLMNLTRKLTGKANDEQIVELHRIAANNL